MFMRLWRRGLRLCRKATSSRANWLRPCSNQICNSIKCPSKWRWGVTERGMEREWECQCWLADRMVEMLTCSLALWQNPQGPSRELIDFIQGLMVGRRESQQGPQPLTYLAGLECPTHNADLLVIITEAITFTYSPSWQLPLQCLWRMKKSENHTALQSTCWKWSDKLTCFLI